MLISSSQFHPLDLDVSAHAVLDYAVLHLHVQHSMRDILRYAYDSVLTSMTLVAIVGHSHCGGVQAAYKEAVGEHRGYAIFEAKESNAQESFTFQDDSRHLLEPESTTRNVPKSESTPDVPKAINSWLTPLTELARQLDDDCQFVPDHAASIAILTEASVKKQVRNVADTFPKGGTDRHHLANDVWVHGWVYEVETGRLRDLEVTEQLTAYVIPK